MGQVPIDETYPLSGVHANAVNTILTGSFIRELPSRRQRPESRSLLLLAVTALSFHRSALVSAGGTVGLGGLLATAAGLAVLAVATCWSRWSGRSSSWCLGWAGLSTWHAARKRPGPS
ncbi:MAG: hypothetical protein MZU95_02775 [Desulfomicrobium escambiense]|nr:hypothetical protein [Desulfomicrobium escambiense]